ncbi:MAG: DUF4349 domain-containing protein [Oscillospiraceae bacterium]
MKKIALLLAAVMLAVLLCGCGASSSDASYAAAEDMYYAPMTEEAAGEYWADDYGAASPAEEPVPMPLSAETTGSVPNAAKLIYTADLDMETLEFENAVSTLKSLTSACGGYFEYSSVSDRGSCRWAEYTIRIPAEQYRTFLDGAGETCHVLSLNEYTEDVSETYYDTAGRLKTQQTKLERLQELLAEAENMEDIILLESAISETEERIDSLSGTLRHYDALVDYSTVTVYLEEVKVYEPEPDPSYGTRLGTAFTDGWHGFVEGLGDLLIALAYSWLWLLLIAGILALILWLTRKRRAARREARAGRKAQKKTASHAPANYSTPADNEKE